MKTLIAAMFLGGLTLGATDDSLDIYFIDVEGGQATLIVTPAKQALLVDGGQPVETSANVVVPYSAYAAARSRGKHIVPKPGDRIPLEGVDVRVLTAGGASLSAAVDGAGQANPGCASLDAHGDDPSGNRRSVSLRITFGSFRFLDLADLNWNALVRLVCPNNLIGKADLFLVPHHSNSDAGVPALISAVDARAIVSNNSATKGGAADTFAMLRRRHERAQRGIEDVPMTPRYFTTGPAFRAWLETHHATRRELIVGFYKRGYRRLATWFVVSARKEETQLKRLDTLIAMSARGQRLQALVPKSRRVRLQADRR